MDNSILERASLHNISSIKLTRWGMLRLSIFNDAALTFADNNYDPAYGNSFNHFVNLCVQFNKDNGLRIDWKTAYALTEDKPADEDFVEKPTAAFRTRLAPKKPSGNYSRESTGLSLEERLRNSAAKYQTVMRPFWGRPETLTEEERKTLLIKPDSFNIEEFEAK